MGVVFKARQLRLNRPVALKMLLGGHLGSAQALARFRNEAETVARLQHPHIVQIYEIGEVNGMPFFSMELVEGSSLAELLRQGPLKADTAARLIEILALAMHAAHEHGILHRDLKPANILLPRSPPPAAPPPGAWDFEMPKIADFGLAKQLDNQQLQTQSGTILGTPSYMAPEQAGAIEDGNAPRGIGPAADVYALGAILYECLTGRPPFLAETPLETLLRVLGDEPVPPRQLQPSCPRDLQTICLHCLNKQPQRRYASARALADDLAHFRAGEPIRARPVGVGERLLKWVRRRPAIAALLVLVVLVTLAGLSLVTWKWREAARAWQSEQEQRFQAERAQGNEERQRLRAEGALYFNRIAFASRERTAGNVRQAEELLALCPPSRRRWEWHYLQRLCHGELLTLDNHKDVVNVLAFSPDGTLLASGSGHPHQPGSRGLVKLWKTSTWEEVRTLRGHSVAVTNLSFSPKGDRLMSAGFTLDTGKLSRGAEQLEEAARGEVRLWSVETGYNRLNLAGYTSGAWTLQDELCAAGHLGKKTVVVWNTRTGGKPLVKLPDHPGLITKIMVTPDGRRMITCWMSTAVGALARGEVKAQYASRVGVKIWDARTGAPVLALDGFSAPQLSPDGKRLAAVHDQVVQVWDLEQALKDNGRSPLLTLHGHAQTVNHLAFSRDGRHLATGSMDKIVRIWSLQTGQGVLTLRGHHDMVVDVRFSPDDRRLLSASWDGTIKVWDATRDPDCRALKGHANSITDLAFAPDSRHLASVAADGLRLWDISVRKEVLHVREGYQSVALSADGKRLAAGIRPNKVRLWNLEGWKASGPPPPALATLEGHAGRVTALAFSPDSRLLAAGSADPQDGAKPGKLLLADATTGAPLRELKGLTASVLGLAFRPDGRRLAVGLMDGRVLTYDPATGAEVMRLETAPQAKGFSIPLISVAYSPDGTRLAASTGNALAPDNPGQIVVWDANTGERLLELRGHSATVNSLAFSPDGRRLASASWDMNRGAFGEVKLWDVATGTDILTLPGHASVAFSPDGRFLAALGSDAEGAPVIKVWDGSPRTNLP
jgi:WD40 repeat protein